MSLTDKQSRFVDEYLIDFNGTQAAIRAGYSERTAAAQSSRLLTNVKVQAHLKDLQASHSERRQITLDTITDMHLKAFDVAEQTLTPAAMTAAAQNLAKLHGLIVDKGEMKVTAKHDVWLDLLGDVKDAD